MKTYPKSTGYFVDTNIFLRTLINDNQEMHNDCITFLKLVKKNKYKAVTSGIVLAEVIWTLSSFYKFNKDKVVQAVKSIINLPGLKVVEVSDYQKAIELYADNSVKYIDSVIASCDKLQDKKWTVVSYDKDFDRLGVVRVAPGNLV